MRCRTVFAGFVAALVAVALLGVGGCSGAAVTGWSGLAESTVTSPLVRGLSQTVDVTCRIQADQAASVASVSADLSGVGGPAAQPLTKGESDTWTWSGKLVPTQAGERTVTLRVRTSDGQDHTGTATVLVNEPDGTSDGSGADPNNQPPKVSGEAASTTGIEGVNGAAAVSCTATDADGTVVGVTADLSAVGGAAGVDLTHGSGDQWAWEGRLTPKAEGDYTIPIVATDDDGATGEGAASVTIGPGFTMEVTPGEFAIDVFDYDPHSFTATITPTPPANAKVTYRWTTQTLYNAQVLEPGAGYFPDAEAEVLYPQEFVTEDPTAAFQVVPQPWNPYVPIPLDTMVACTATVKLDVGDASGGGDHVDGTITQEGADVAAKIKQESKDEGGVRQRAAIACFEWAIGTPTTPQPGYAVKTWLVAFTNGKSPNDILNIAASQGLSIPTEGYTGFQFELVTWSSDSGLPEASFEQNVERLEEAYGDLKGKVTAYPYD
jgi:hypothetical protein